MQKIFEPRQFFDAAEYLREKADSELIKGDDGYLRSSISRYYYAAFISTRDKFGRTSRGASGHKDVLDFIASQRNDSEQGLKFKAVYDNLIALKELREKADYESASNCATKDGRKSKSLSEQVLTTLSSI